MADPLQTQVQVQDIPEYLRDYRSALLNAAFQSVFSRPFLENNFRGATWYTGGAQGQPPQAPPPASGAGGGAPAGGGDTRTDTQVPESEADKAARGIAGALAMASGQMPKILGMVWDPKTRTYIPEKYKPVVTMSEGGDLSELIDKYAAIREDIPVSLGGDVEEYISRPTVEEFKSRITGGVRNPVVGNMSPGGYASTWTIPGMSSSNITQFNPQPNISSGTTNTSSGSSYGSNYGSGSGSNVGTGSRGPRTATGSGGISSVVPTPSRPQGVTGAPPVGTSSSAAVLPQFASGAAGTTAESRGAGGYNPAQYATDQQAAGLASLLGSRVSSTNPIGPGAPPPQNILDFGDGAQLNAGLVQQALGNITVDGVSRARTPSEMTQSLAGLRAEIAAGGGDTSQIDRLIQQNTQAYTSGATTSPIGRPAASSGQSSVAAPVDRRGGAGDSGFDRTKNTPADFSGDIGEPIAGRGADVSGVRGLSPTYTAQADKRGGASGDEKYALQSLSYPIATTARNAQEEDEWVRKNAEGYAGGGTLAQFDIGDDGKVRNYRKGGAIRKNDGGGFGMAQATPPPQNLGGFGVAQTPTSGGFGGPGGAAGFWNMVNPNAQVGTSVFNAPPVYGGQRNLMMGGDFGQYNPRTGYTVSDLTRGALGNLGDLPSVYGKMIGADKQEYTGILPGTDFGKGVSNVNWAADIAGTSAGAGLNLLDQLGLTETGTAPKEEDTYLMSRLTGKDGLESELRLNTPISLDPLETPPITDPTGVTAGRTQVGEFGAPQAEQYMSPYQRAVTETQKREAQRQAAMQKAGRSAAAVRSGAFGGSRQAIQEGMAEEALQRQLGDIEAAGTQRAFESAQAQFERDRAASLASQQANLRANLEAQLANQQAGLTAGQARLQSALATQQLGATTGLEAAKANLGAQMGLTQAKLDAISRASQEQQQARQQAFGNKLAALQQAQAGAQGLAGMGGTLMGIPGMAQQLELQRLAAMQQGGGYIDALTRQAMDLQYQDFINQQNFPYQQMNFLSGILGGVPTGMQVEGVQFARPAGGGLSGLLTSGAGLLMNQLNK